MIIGQAKTGRNYNGIFDQRIAPGTNVLQQLLKQNLEEMHISGDENLEEMRNFNYNNLDEMHFR